MCCPTEYSLCHIGGGYFLQEHVVGVLKMTKPFLDSSKKECLKKTTHLFMPPILRNTGLQPYPTLSCPALPYPTLPYPTLRTLLYTTPHYTALQCTALHCTDARAQTHTHTDTHILEKLTTPHPTPNTHTRLVCFGVLQRVVWEVVCSGVSQMCTIGTGVFPLCERNKSTLKPWETYDHHVVGTYRGIISPGFLGGAGFRPSTV